MESIIVNSNLFLYSATLSLFVSGLFCAYTKWRHICVPYRSNPDFYYPSRRKWIFTYAMSILLIGCILQPNNPDNWIAARCFCLLITPNLIVTGIIKHCSQIKKLEIKLILLSHIPITFQIIITILGWLDMDILQAYEFKILFITGALGIIFSIAIMRTLFWLKEQMRIFYENKYSNEEEFPNNFAKDIIPRIIIMLPIIWLTFITKNPYVMGVAFLIITGAYVFFLNYVLDSHIQPIPEEYQPKDAINPITEADEMTESLNEDEGLATRPNEGFEDHLQQLMETEKPYLNPNLTIMELARMMNTNVPTLRNVSKQKYGSFIKMVNFYRLSHAKELHKEHPEYSKQAIAEDSGFGSYRSLLRAEKAENE